MRKCLSLIYVTEKFVKLTLFQSSFVRTNTPHPKELKARHAKLFKKDVDGSIIPSSSDKTKQDGITFVPSREKDISSGDDGDILEHNTLQGSPIDNALFSY